MMDFGVTTWVAGLACAGAVIFAAHAPKDGRWEAVSLACLLLINWALFVLAYTDWSPKLALANLGIETSSIHLWTLADAIGGCAAMAIGYQFWWGRLLWAVSLLQMVFHAGIDMAILDPVVYVDYLLNGALLVQLAIFFRIGGGSIGRNLHRGLDSLGLLRRSAYSARTEAP